MSNEPAEPDPAGRLHHRHAQPGVCLRRFRADRSADSSRTPKRGERLATPRTLAEVDLTAIVAALATAKTEGAEKPKEDPRRHAQLEAELATAKARIDTLEEKNRELTGRLERIAALAAAGPVFAPDAAALPEHPRAKSKRRPFGRCAL